MRVSHTMRSELALFLKYRVQSGDHRTDLPISNAKSQVTDINALVVIPASTRVLACKVDFRMDNPL